MITIKKGLDLPIGGAPAITLDDKPPRTVAVLGPDYIGMKPTMAVREGDRVVAGQELFTDKKTPGVRFTAPAAGTVSAINRGAKRVLLSVVVDVQGDEAETFAAGTPGTMGRDAIVETLVASGLWPALRTRPFSRVPEIDAEPSAIFVTAMDTNPLAGDAHFIISQAEEAFAAGVDALAELTRGTVYVCHEAGKEPPVGSNPRVRTEAFGGVHPAGLAGTHIHFLEPVHANKTVWTIGYQDVIAVGRLLQTGRLDSSRTVALAGPGIRNPRLLRTTLGASTDELTAGELADGEQRTVSGSVLAGHTARGALAFLGRYHNQVCVLPEGRERKLFGYLTPGPKSHSVFPIYLSAWRKRRALDFSTTTNGSTRGMVPIGTYDSVMPLDILATQLMRALLVGDIERAINLGALELDEEDVATCTYACPGKYEFGPVLRTVLDQIHKEG
ncbi:MAG: Na(+)-translocating NADH-quinone reductase subunit A [Pseudomonadota bacterium]